MPESARTSGAPRRSGTSLPPQIIEHLSAYPDADFTPTEVQRALRLASSGAVANALATLEGKGHVMLTCERPMRYRITPAIDAAATAPAEAA